MQNTHLIFHLHVTENMKNMTCIYCNFLPNNGIIQFSFSCITNKRELRGVALKCFNNIINEIV